MKEIITFFLCCLMYSAQAQRDEYVDPMPKKQRDRLPKPTVVIHVSGACYPMVEGPNWISIGPNEWGFVEIWSLKNFALLEKAEERWYKKGGALRKWIGNYNYNNIPR